MANEQVRALVAKEYPDVHRLFTSIPYWEWARKVLRGMAVVIGIILAAIVLVFFWFKIYHKKTPDFLELLLICVLPLVAFVASGWLFTTLRGQDIVDTDLPLAVNLIKQGKKVSLAEVSDAYNLPFIFTLYG